MLDDDKPRNSVTKESHGFITRDDIKPTEFRQIAHEELCRYPSLECKNIEVTLVNKNQITFEFVTSMGEKYQSKTVVIATDLKEILPSIDNMSGLW